MTDGPAAGPMAGGGDQEVLSVRQLEKAFGATRALRGVSLGLARGEVRALLGHNGSGKSTLIKILSGYHRPDAGEITIHGTPLRPPVTSATLSRIGLGVLHQDLGLVDTMSVLENVRIGTMTCNRLRKISWRRERDQVAALLQDVGLRIDPLTVAGRLPAAERVIVAIARAFQVAGHDAARTPVIVLDEPTAALGESETGMLFASVRRLSARGCAFLIVTHKPQEALDLATAVTVLRDGLVVADREVPGMTAGDLTRLIAGPAGTAPAARPSPPRPSATGRGTLTVDGLTGPHVRGLSLSVRAGEIVGLTGLQGSGFEEVCGLVFGAAAPAAGTVSLDGQTLGRGQPWRSVRAGMAFVSGDRLREGGIGRASLSENVSMTNLRKLAGWTGRIRRRGEHALVSSVVRDFGIRPPHPRARFATLSGGNQQKALIGRWLRGGARMLVMHEPTAGVDVGAVADITGMLRAFAADGGAVLVSSSQAEDLVALCDRVIVLVGGRAAAEFSSADLTPASLIHASYGGAHAR